MNGLSRRTIRAIFLDVDNTLLDFDGYVRESLKEGFVKFGIGPCDESTFERFHTVNEGLWRQIEQGRLTFAELEKIRFQKVFEVLGVTGDGPAFERFFRAQLNESAIPVPGAKEILAYLHPGYILCAASNGPYQQQVHRLELAGMKKYFDFLFISEEIGVQKPETEFFDRCLQRIHQGPLSRTVPVHAVTDPTVIPVLPQEIVIIGDSLTSDMAGGREMGFGCIYYDRSGNVCRDEEAPLPVGVDAVVHSLEEVKEIL